MRLMSKILSLSRRSREGLVKVVSKLKLSRIDIAWKGEICSVSGCSEVSYTESSLVIRKQISKLPRR